MWSRLSYRAPPKDGDSRLGGGSTATASEAAAAPTSRAAERPAAVAARPASPAAPRAAPRPSRPSRPSAPRLGGKRGRKNTYVSHVTCHVHTRTYMCWRTLAPELARRPQSGPAQRLALAPSAQHWRRAPSTGAERPGDVWQRPRSATCCRRMTH